MTIVTSASLALIAASGSGKGLEGRSVMQNIYPRETPDAPVRARQLAAAFRPCRDGREVIVVFGRHTLAEQSAESAREDQGTDHARDGRASNS